MMPSAMTDPPRQTGTYSDYIAEMVEFYLVRRKDTDSMEPLLLALGLPTVGRGQVSFEVTKPQLEPEDQPSEAVISKTLTLALHSHLRTLPARIEDSVSILGALARRQRWRDCLNDMDNTCAFAGLAAHVVSMLEDDSATLYIGEDVGAIFQPDLCKMLNEWLDPDIDYVHTPSMDSFTRTLFGDAWCDLARHVSRSDPASIASCIMALRPAFLRDFAPVQIDIAAATLPVLTDELASG